jgi:hypothetical protein
VFKKIMAAAGAAVLGAMVLTGCSSVSTPPDQVALHYKAGPIESTKFSDCVVPRRLQPCGAFSCPNYTPEDCTSKTICGTVPV